MNAFKLVRDNSYRNDSDRFRKILDSLPRKVKATINVDEYEDTLARSEAVFYHHVVLHTNGHHSHITAIRIADKENLGQNCTNNHSPLLCRFGDDLNFLGETETNRSLKSTPVSQCASLDNRESNNLPAVVGNRTSIADASIVKNPYSKNSNNNGDGRMQGGTKSKTNPARNRFSGYACTQSSESNIRKYLKQDDVRFVKRRFPSCSSEKSNNRLQQKSIFSLIGKELGQPAKSSNKAAGLASASTFDYGADQEDSDATSILGSTTSGASRTSTSDMMRHNDDYNRVVDNSRSMGSTRSKYSPANSMSDLGDSDFSPPAMDRDGGNGDEVVIQSKYFRNSSARRITLEPADMERVGRLERRKSQKTSHASTPSSNSSRTPFADDVVDSPPAVKPVESGRKSCRSSAFGRGLKLGAPMRRRVGAIETGFQKQRLLSTSRNSRASTVDSSASMVTKRGATARVTKSFFKPRQPEATP